MSTPVKEKHRTGFTAEDEDSWIQQDAMALAATVQRLGERNWMAVARIMKTLGFREADWYTPKKCYVHYTKLLKLVDDKMTKKRPMSRVDRENLEDLLLKRMHDQRMQELLTRAEECEHLNSAFLDIDEMIDDGCFDEGADLELLNEEVERFCDIWDDPCTTEVYDIDSTSPTQVKKFLRSPNVTKGKSSVGMGDALTSEGEATPVDSEMVEQVPNTSQLCLPSLPSPQPFFNPTSALASAAALQLAVATSPVPQTSFARIDSSEVITSPSKVAAASTVTSVTLSAPTLSKLLEMPPSVPGKLPPLPTLYSSQYVPVNPPAVPEEKEEQPKAAPAEETVWQFRLRGCVGREKDNKDNQGENDMPNIEGTSYLLSNNMSREQPENIPDDSVDDFMKQDVNSQDNLDDNADSAPDTEVLSSESSVNFGSDNNEPGRESENIAADSKADEQSISSEKQAEDLEAKKLDIERQILENMDADTINGEIETGMDADLTTTSSQDSGGKKENGEGLKVTPVIDIVEDTVTSDITETETIIDASSSHSFDIGKNLDRSPDAASSSDTVVTRTQEQSSSTTDTSQSSAEKGLSLSSKEKFVPTQLQQPSTDVDMEDSEDTPLVEIINQQNKKAANANSSTSSTSPVVGTANSESDLARSETPERSLPSTPRKAEKSPCKSTSSSPRKSRSSSTPREHQSPQKSSAASLTDYFTSSTKGQATESSPSPQKHSTSPQIDESPQSHSPRKGQKATPASSPKKPQRAFSFDEPSVSLRKLKSTQTSTVSVSSLRKSKQPAASSRDQPPPVSSSRSSLRSYSEANQAARQPVSQPTKSSPRAARNSSSRSPQSKKRQRNVSPISPVLPSDESTQSDGSSTLELSPKADSTTLDESTTVAVRKEPEVEETNKRRENESTKQSKVADKSSSSSPPAKSQRGSRAESRKSPAQTRSQQKSPPRKKVLSRRGRRGGRTVPKSSSNSPEDLSESQPEIEPSPKPGKSSSSDTSSRGKTATESKSKNADASNSAPDNDKIQTRAVSRYSPRGGRRGRRGRGRASTRMQAESTRRAAKEEDAIEDADKVGLKENAKAKCENEKESSERDSLPKIGKKEEEIERDLFEDACEKKKGKSTTDKVEVSFTKSDEKRDDSSLSLPISPMITDELFKVKEKDILYNKKNTQWSPQSSAPASQSMVTPTTSDSSDESSEDSDESVRTANSNEAANYGKKVPKSKRFRKDREAQHQYKRWKKSICMIWREASYHKYASIFSQKVTDDVAPGYEGIVNRPMDLSLIKKKIDNGTITTTEEFQRDIMLMFQNAIMYNSSDHDVYEMAVQMQADVNKLVQDYLATQLMIDENIKEPPVPQVLRAGRQVKSQPKTQRAHYSKSCKE